MTKPLATYAPQGPRLYAAGFVAGTIFAGALTAGVLVVMIGAEDRFIEHALELAVSLGFLGLGIHQANTFIGYAFHVFDEGFSQRRRQGEGEIVPWSAVAHLRPRPIWQRLDLRARDGRLLATLEYQVAGVEQAFVDLVTRAAPPPPALPFTLRRGWSSARVARAATIAASSWLAVMVARSQPLNAAPFAIVALGLAYGWYSNTRAALRQVTMYAHGLVVHRGGVELIIPWSDVVHVAFDSRGGARNTHMSAFVALRDGTSERIVPGGREAGVVMAYAAAQSAWRHAMSGASARNANEVK